MNISKICVIHLNQIGDLVFSLPLLKALKEHYPASELHSVIKPHLACLLDGSPWVDRIILRGKEISSRLQLVRSLRRERYDLLVSLPRSEEALVLAALSNARLKAGFSHAPWDLSLDVSVKIKGHHGWFNNRRLLQRLNIPIVKDDYVGLLPAASWACPHELPERIAVFAPCASGRRQTKSWEAERFAGVMEYLKRRHGLCPVLVGGAGDAEHNRLIEQAAIEKSSNSLGVVNLTGSVSLKELCAVIRQARLAVGIDSGVMHLASCLDVPLVVLFGPTDTKFVGPHNEQSIVIQHTEMDCVPCYLKDCGHTACMKRITVDEVTQACDGLLSDAR